VGGRETKKWVVGKHDKKNIGKDWKDFFFKATRKTLKKA
jgi:hypothetical protein